MIGLGKVNGGVETSGSSAVFKVLRWVFFLILVAAAVMLLGGSAVWHLLGLTDDLTIEGRSEVVAERPVGLGVGWPTYGGDEGGNRFSIAGQITPENVDQLEVAWTYQTRALDDPERAKNDTSFQMTPILVEQHLIMCSPFNEIMAVDAVTGEEIWHHDPGVSLGRNPGNEYNCRGVAYWNDDQADPDAVCASRVFAATVEAKIIAVDAQTGDTCDDFGFAGEVQIEPSLSLRWPGEFQITSAPVIIGDVIVTGTSIGDNLRTDAPLGVVHAFNARTGAPVWNFNPIPIDSERVGHANVWSTMSVDTERGLVFLPTSSPSPDYFGGDRPGNNEYANSVVALNGETGEVVWSYQIVHHDVWDYDLPAQPGLYQITREGETHDVVAQVTKMGLVFVLDRDTGEPFLPVEERPVPQGGVEGEVLSETQPFPTQTPPIVPNSLDPNEAFGVTIWDKMACANELKALRQDGLYTPPTLDGSLAYPFTGGGANWGSAAFDPARNLLVINMNNMAQSMRLYPEVERRDQVDSLKHDAEFAPMEGAPYSMSRRPILSPLGLPCSAPPWGVIAGVDLESGEIVWRHPIGTTEDLAPGGLALELGTPAFGGPIITAGGLIFIAGTLDNYLRALDVETGKELWKGRLPAGGQATPMTYIRDGRQYVVIAAGGHAKSGTKTGDHVVAFALPERKSQQ